MLKTNQHKFVNVAFLALSCLYHYQSASEVIHQDMSEFVLDSNTAGHIIVEAEMSQKLSWRDLFVQIELGVDITSLGIK